MNNQNRITIIFVLFAVLLGSCSAPLRTDRDAGPQISYLVDVTNPLDDLFHVTVETKNLSARNNIYHFAATAPGTYSILDFGRFVQSFKAFDASGSEIPAERLSTNEWKIVDSERLARIEYDIEDSFDADVEEHPVAPMSGSGIDTNYAAFNTFAVLGYFEGLQSAPVRMNVEYQRGWIIGTALDKNQDGSYIAETFDRLADSPVLTGKLSFTETKVNDIDVGIYVYTFDTSYTAQTVLRMADDVLQSAGSFAGYSPVPYYKFLFVFLDVPTFQRYGLTTAGALEHSYSSIYVLPVTPSAVGTLQSTMAHEFMHILTPLNLHSEIIHSFNFSSPTPSEHLWLYEGVTEWVSDIMQLRSGLMTTDEFLKQLSLKLTINDNFDKDMSLSHMALNVYTAEGGREFGNIYNRGAAVAALLDIRLLELSNGAKGLREVFLHLLDKYGKQRPFPEKEFFDILVAETYPEIRQFVDDYIRGTKELPYKEYLAKLGFSYASEKPSDDSRPSIGVSLTGDDNGNLVVGDVASWAGGSGFKKGDIFVKLLGQELTLQSARQVFGKLNEMNVGDKYTAVVQRDGREMEIGGTLVRRMIHHVFEDTENLTDKQELLRRSWLGKP
ncbi:MAG TPA: peptidase [Bacteroidota bacterium]